MHAVLFVLLMCFHDPSAVTNASVRSVGSVSGVTRQQQQTARYVVSKVTIEGANAFNTDQILSLSKLNVGQVVNDKTIAKARDAVLRAYNNRGRIKANVGIQPNFKQAVRGAKLGVAEISIKIDEGAVFVLRRLEFVGNATTRDRIVRRRVLQQEGEPFSQALMERSVNRLNSLRRFEKLTISDVERRVDEKERSVDLVIHLKEIKSSQTRR